MIKGLDARAAEIERLYAEGCTQRQIARAFDVTQAAIHSAMRRHGIAARPAVRRPGRGPANPAWKGDAASYAAFHMRIRLLRGTPSRCERCGLDDPDRMYHWANLTGNYADPDDYQRMCVPCHKRYDLARIKAAKAVAA